MRIVPKSSERIHEFAFTDLLMRGESEGLGAIPRGRDEGFFLGSVALPECCSSSLTTTIATKEYTRNVQIFKLGENNAK
jgi:hypothetical protein